MSGERSEKNAPEKDVGSQKSRVAKKAERVAESGPRRLAAAAGRGGAAERVAESGPRRLAAAATPLKSRE